MSRPRADLVRELAEGLRPVGPGAGRVAPRLTVWVLLSASFVLGVILATGPLRPGVGVQLLHAPQLAFEILAGAAVAGAGALAALRLGVPQPAPAARRVRLFALAAGFWVALLLIALLHPAAEPSMLGKREHCNYQTFLLALPPALLGLWLLRPLAAFQRWLAGAIVGAAAGAIPAVAMQLACMYAPDHALIAHVAPVLGVIVVGGVLGPLLLRRI